MTEVLRPRRQGELLGQTFNLVMRSLGKLFLIQLVVWIPIVVVATVVAVGVSRMEFDEPGMSEAMTGLAVALSVTVLYLFLGPIVQGASVLAVADHFTGRNSTVRECLGVAGRKIVRLILLGLLVGAVVVVGMMACLLPGLYLTVRLYLAVQVLMIEDTTIKESINRSWELTKGAFWKVAGFVAMVGLISVIITMAIELPLELAARMSESAAVIFGASLLAQFVGSIAGGIIAMVASVVIYFELRTRKEALDMEGLVELVDRLAPRPAEGV